MKSTICIMIAASIGFMFMTSANVHEYDVAYSDSVQCEAIQYINKIDEANEKAKDYLLDTIHTIRDNNEPHLCKVERVIEVVCEPIEVHDTITLCTREKVVYSVYSSRGAHVDSIICN